MSNTWRVRRFMAASMVLVACSGPSAVPDAPNPCTSVPSAQVLASEHAPDQNRGLPDDVAVDDQYVYWVDFDGDAVRRVPKRGGAAETLASNVGAPQHLVVDATTIYWIGGEGDVKSIPKTGGSVGHPIFGGGDCPPNFFPCGGAIALDDQATYWYEEAVPQTIFRAEKNGGAVVRLASPSGPWESGLAVDETYVYYGGSLLADHSIRQVLERIPKLGGAGETLATFDLMSPSIALDATNVYVPADGGVWRVPKDLSAPVLIAASIVPRSITVDATNAYGTAGTMIERIPLAGGESSMVACDQVSALAIVADDTHVYWNDQTADTIVAAPKL